MPEWKKAMAEARGLAKIDLILRRARLVNVFSGEIHETDIGVHQGRFVGIGTYTDADQVIDLHGKFVAPGLIDGHVHIESSQLCPEEFCSLLLAHGVTTAVVDPHEIANVYGVKGISYILDSVKPLPFNAYVALPSCVPATNMETSGACLEAEDLRQFLHDPQVIGLGEVMDYPGVLEGSLGIVEKLELPVLHRDGHAPGISPQDLNAYFLAGIDTEHECSEAEEALERLRRGYYVMLREGSAAKNLLSLLPAVNAENSRHCFLVTDDRHPTDLLKEGSVDHLVRLAIKAGQPAVRAIQMATINAARAFGLSRLGGVAPGYQADFVILSDLEEFVIEEVYWQGIRQSSRGELPSFQRNSTVGIIDSMQVGDWALEKLRVPAGLAEAIYASGSCVTGGSRFGGNQSDGRVSARVIGVHGHSLVTANLICELPVENGFVQPDPEQGIAKLAVVERHKATGNTGVGFVKGLGLHKGAIVSTVAHDSHNMVVAGMSDEEIDLAVRTCIQMGGGLCLVEGDQVLGKLPLPIAGLMSEESPEQVAAALTELHQKAHSLGIAHDVDPFMTLAFLSLPVIPELKLTDMGLVDVQKFSFTELLLMKDGV